MTYIAEKILGFALAATMLTGCGKDIYDSNQHKLRLKTEKCFLDVKDDVQGPFITVRKDNTKRKLKGLELVYKSGNETLSIETVSDGNKIIYLQEVARLRYSRTDENGMTRTVEHQDIKKIMTVATPDSTILFQKHAFADIDHGIPLLRRFVRMGKDASFHMARINTPYHAKHMQEEVEKQKEQIAQFAAPYTP